VLTAIRRSTPARATGIAGLITAAVLATAAPVRADSSTVTAEPTIVPGHQEFGNSTGDTRISLAWVASYWGLPVIAGDRVTVDIQGTATQNESFAFYAEPVGTQNDLGIDQLSADAVGRADENARNLGVCHFSAPQTGTMPLAFTTGYIDAGPYDFTVNVRHAVDMRLPGIHRVARAGTLRVQAHDPDGRPLTVPGLTIRLQYETSGHHWKAVGHASPRRGGAHVHYRLPARLAGHVVHLRAKASGGGYFTRVTVSRRVRVG
jgi:hypothetical protein